MMIYLLVMMLSAVILSAGMLNDVMLSAVMLSAGMLHDVMLSAVLLNADMPKCFHA
jgi:hypothetical protein